MDLRVPYSSAYRQGGIWGVMALFCNEKSISPWGVLYSLPHQNEMVEPALPLHAPEKKLPEFVAISEDVSWQDDKEWTYIPVWYQKRHYFTLTLFSRGFLPNRETLEDLQIYLQMLLAYEIAHALQYPTFYPFLYSSLSEFPLINHRLREKNHFYFLNGQNGTGKKTFVQSFVLYHFYYRLVLETSAENFKVYHIRDEQKKSVEVWWVNELAYLDTDWQEKIFSSNSPLRFIFVASVYSPQALLDGNLIHKNMHSLCTQNLVLFPSLARRLPELRNLLNFTCLYRFLADAVSYETLESIRQQIEKGYITENLRGLLQHFGEVLQSQPSTQGIDVRGRKLDDLVVELEKEAIKAAHQAVGKSQQKIADYLGISRGSLQYKIRQYNISYQDWEEK